MKLDKTLPAQGELEEASAAAPTVGELFTGFFSLGIIGFGGVLPLTRRMVVEQRRWMSGDEFTELLSLCQFLPGGNILNLSVTVGLRFRGPLGGLAAITGLISAPAVIVTLLGIVYARYQNDPVIRHVFAGLAASAAGLLVAMAVKIALPLRTKPTPTIFAVLCFVAIFVLRLPLLPTMLVLAPISILACWRFPG